MRFLLCFFALLLPLAAQEKETPPVAPPIDWLEFANDVTNDIVNDDWRVHGVDSAVLQARLAQVWWKHDPGRAKHWLQDSIDHVSRAPQNESEEEGQERELAAKAVLTIAAGLDARAADRLVKYLKERDDPKRTPKQLTDVPLGELLARAALEKLNDGDLESAYRLASQSLSFGGGSAFQNVLYSIQKDRTKSDSLFREGLAAIDRGHFDRSLVGTLVRYAFPWHNPASGPEPLKAELLSSLSRRLRLPAENPEEREQICQVGQALSRVQHLLAPDERALLLSATGNCSFNQRQSISEEPEVPADPTVDDLLRIAVAHPNAMTRAGLKMRAMNVAAKKDADRLVEIIESFTEDEKQFLDFDQHAAQMLGRIALDAISKGEFSRAYQLIERVPESHRAGVELYIAGMLHRRNDLAAAATLYRRGRTRLAKQKIVEEPYDYAMLVGTSALVAPDELEEVLKLVLKALDSYDDRELMKKGKKSAAVPVEHDFEPLPIANIVSKAEPVVLRAAAKHAERPMLRASYRLALIQQALQRTEQQKAPVNSIAEANEKPEQ